MPKIVMIIDNIPSGYTNGIVMGRSKHALVTLFMYKHIITILVGSGVYAGEVSIVVLT